MVLLTALPAFADDADTSLMVIDAGRLGVMMDQSQRILGLPDDPPGDGNTDTFAILKSAVQQYQRLEPVACARRVHDEICNAAYYSPSWLTQSETPAREVLRARIDAASDHVASLWNALCAKLPKDHDPSLCQME